MKTPDDIRKEAAAAVEQKLRTMTRAEFEQWLAETPAAVVAALSEKRRKES